MLSCGQSQKLPCKYILLTHTYFNRIEKEYAKILRTALRKTFWEYTFWHSRDNGNRHFDTVDIMGIDILGIRGLFKYEFK